MPGKIHFPGIGVRAAKHRISSLLSKWSPQCSLEASGWGDFCAAHNFHTLGKCSHESLIRLPLFCQETLIEQIRSAAGEINCPVPSFHDVQYDGRQLEVPESVINARQSMERVDAVCLELAWTSGLV
jgi:hypothetical protein